MLCQWQNKLVRRRVILLVTTIAIVALDGLHFQLCKISLIKIRDRAFDNYSEIMIEQRSLRNRNLSGCEKSPYISPEQAEDFLSSASKRNFDGYYDSISEPAEPTHITLCKALIDRNAESEGQDYEQEAKETEAAVGGSNPFYGKFRVRKNGFLTVNESREVCTDWERPHSAFMQIISSSIVAYVGSRFGLNYKHNCASTITSDKYLDFDITTVQQIFSQITMKMNERVLSLGDVVFDLCQSCIDKENDPEFMRQRQDMKQNNIEDTHHCFLFPNKGEVHTQYFQMEDGEGPTEEILDEEGQFVKTALESVLPLVRNRLYHASLDWAPKAHIPSYEPRSGVIIYLDSQSLPIPFSLYKTYIQDGTTRVSILSSPKCADSKLGDVSCLLYGYELRQYLQNSLSGIEVSFDLVSSTAAAYSRMILSHILICPPGTVTCIFPVLGRQVTKPSIVFESQERHSTFHWFNYLVQSLPSSIRIVPLYKSDLVKVDAEQKIAERQIMSFTDAMKFEGQLSAAKEILQDSENKENTDTIDIGFKSMQQSKDKNTDPNEFTLSIPLLKDHEEENAKKEEVSTEIMFPEFQETSSFSEIANREKSEFDEENSDTSIRQSVTEVSYPQEDYASTARLFGG